jgi:hypothetical protein
MVIHLTVFFDLSVLIQIPDPVKQVEMIGPGFYFVRVILAVIVFPEKGLSLGYQGGDEKAGKTKGADQEKGGFEG